MNNRRFWFGVTVTILTTLAGIAIMAWAWEDCSLMAVLSGFILGAGYCNGLGLTKDWATK